MTFSIWMVHSIVAFEDLVYLTESLDFLELVNQERPDAISVRVCISQRKAMKALNAEVGNQLARYSRSWFQAYYVRETEIGYTDKIDLLKELLSKESQRKPIRKKDTGRSKDGTKGKEIGWICLLNPGDIILPSSIPKFKVDEKILIGKQKICPGRHSLRMDVAEVATHVNEIMHEMTEGLSGTFIRSKVLIEFLSQATATKMSDLYAFVSQGTSEEKRHSWVLTSGH